MFLNSLKVYKAILQGFHNVTDFCGKDDTALVSEIYSLNVRHFSDYL